MGSGGSSVEPVEPVAPVELAAEAEAGGVEGALAKVGTVAVGGTCGAGNGDCDAMGFCRYAEENACGGAGSGGVCEARPRECKRDCPGVCGCDGQRFCNTCVAQARGFSVRHAGACAEAAP